ncbi:TolC family outer membrane protein [Denitrificimonas sp. JX-1]|uniref:TolC family outer membrane protein n=1 Tax=Denitrificimonas halotolerans TaxID=3098930 RepID=A0ABU5GSM0_9GAMM|nr:TolC family outer membrane protein [Denitrificimonas sp. JX-1]MDY7219981.1 TolC family outer membrane protein [Denitrificimonas sp. JX-1]
MMKAQSIPKSLLSTFKLKSSAILAFSLLLPVGLHASPNNGLLPDMAVTSSTLKAPLALRRLDMKQAVQRAIEWHPMVAGAVERSSQQGEEVNFAKSAYYPQVRSGFKTSYRDSDGRSEEAFTINGSQLLYDFGKVSSHVEAAEYGVERSEADTLRVIDELARETALAVLEVRRYQELVSIAGEQVEGVTDLLMLSKKRAEMGASTRSDEMQAQSRREAALASELQLISQLDMWKRTLQNLVGSTVPPEVLAGAPTSLAQACYVNVESLNNVPEIMMADAQRSEALANIKASKADFFPTLSLDAGVEHYLNTRDREVTTGNRRDRTDYTASLNFDVDLYQGGATVARKRGAEYALRAADAARDEALLKISRGLQEATTQAASYERRLSVLDSRIKSIIETQNIYRQQYISLGTRSLLDLLNTEQEIHQARMERKNAQLDLQRLQVECLYNTAGLRDAFALNTGDGY